MVVLVYAILCLIWSSTWLVITYAIDDVPPITAAAVRFWIAALFYMVLHGLRPIRFPASWRLRLGIVAWGFPQIGIGYALVYWSEQYISSGMASVLFATFPFFVAIASAWIIKGEGWTMSKAVGLVCGLVGVIIVLLEQLQAKPGLAPIGVCAVVAAACSCGVSVGFIKRDFGHVDTVALTALQMVGGAVSLTIGALLLESPRLADWTPKAAAATLYLAVFGSALAFLGYYWLLKRMDTTLLATITFVTPVLALFWGWLFRDESLTWSLLAGTVLVLVGVRAIARSAHRRPSFPTAEAA